MALTLELPSQQSQTAFNLSRWSEVLANRELAQFEGRIETDRHGHILMSPPPAPSHGSYQAEIARLLGNTLHSGRVLTECPISTADGVRAADGAWASEVCMKRLGGQVCFPTCPELCVEVISPGNSQGEVQEKMTLYFDAGAAEAWLCSQNGSMTFFGSSGKRMTGSKLCPGFPARVKLR